MKKIIAVLLALVLVAAGLGSLVYASNSSHEPMTGQKLVGVALQGAIDSVHSLLGYFQFTNPDCVSEITIERISIIRKDGTVIYEGPLLRLERDENGEVVAEIEITEPMKPHQIMGVMLGRLMKDPNATDPDRWLTEEEARDLRVRLYTLEIFWSWTDKKGLPLIGWAGKEKWWLGSPSDVRGLSLTPMVNMEQKLTP